MSMKVLIISDAWHPQVNGVVRTYEHLCKELEDMGHKVKVIGPANFPVTIAIPFYREIKLAIFPQKRLEQMIEDFSPDKIHIATEGPLGWGGRKYCLKNNIKYTSCYHTQFPDYIAKRFAWLLPPLYNIIYNYSIKQIRKFHQTSSNIMVATKSLENQLLQWGFTAPIKQLSRGVDFNIFYPEKSSITKKNPLNNKDIFKNIKKPIALYVGRLAIEKNIEAFLDMDWEGSKIIVGEGPLKTNLEKKYTNAIFVGKKTGIELASYYRFADIFVFPSKTDTFGMVIIEALACGLPVAAYNVMGPKDIITNNYLGALDDNDLSKAAKTTYDISSNKENKIKCANHVKENYNWENAGKQFLEAL